MTPKAKAKELVKQFLPFVDCNDLQKNCTNKEWELRNAKRCALIAVDEIIKETKLHDKTIYQHGRTFYWQEVKQEIEKL